MDAIEKEVTSNLLGVTEIFSNETGRQKKRRIAKQEEEYKRQTAGLDLTIPKLQRIEVAPPQAPLTKFAEPVATRDNSSLLEKGLQKFGEALGVVNDLTNKGAAEVAPVEEKKILGLKPFNFWMLTAGLVLTTITVIAVKRKTSKLKTHGTIYPYKA